MKNKQTILIVDDIEENVDILVELLNEHDLVTALDAKTAIEILKEEEIDLILLDIMMPVMDGFELCEVLKQSEKTSHIPIIFLSAKDKSEDIQKGFEIGGVDYITKPFKPLELLSRITTHLKLRAYEKNLETRVEEELEKNRVKQQMLYQQAKQAALGELLVHIAHQWKQPLASLGSINLLNRTKVARLDTPLKQEFLDSIIKSEELISHMATTINTFQEFYQPSNENEEFWIKDTLLNVLSIVEATFDFDNVKVYVTANEETKTFANPNEISQIIFSILSNAREILKSEGIQKPEIHIRIKSQQISIHDNGGGVKEELIESIFNPYVSTKGSTGLGLSLSYGVAQKNNAVLSVKNEDNGSTFMLEFITWMS